MNAHEGAKKPKKEKKQQWPYVTWSEADQAWKVDARTKEGGSRKFFEKKTEADTFAQVCRIERENSGTAAFGNSELTSFGWTIQDAITFALKHLRQQARSLPIGDAMKELIEAKRAAGRTEDYCYHLGLRLGRFRDAHLGRTIASVTAKELEIWLTALKAPAGTRNTYRRDLQTLFSFCVKRGYCESNEAAKTDVASGENKPPGILTPTQCGTLLAQCRVDVLPYVAIGMFAGLRAAELEKLDWAEVDLESGFIEVTAVKSKTRKRRLVPIQPNLRAWLLPCVGVGSVAPTSLRRSFEAARDAAGLRAWPANALRHSFGSYRLAQCQDAARVSLEMGNSPQIVFSHYRELVKPKDAERFWNLFPQETAGKIVSIA